MDENRIDILFCFRILKNRLFFSPQFFQIVTNRIIVFIDKYTITMVILEFSHRWPLLC
jgi:hypothetical protein